MKLKFDFAVREIVGEYVMVPLGQGALEFGGMISTSETGAMLVEALKKDVSQQALLEMILNQYEIDEEAATADLNDFLSQLRKLNLLIE